MEERVFGMGQDKCSIHKSEIESIKDTLMAHGKKFDELQLKYDKLQIEKAGREEVFEIKNMMYELKSGLKSLEMDMADSKVDIRNMTEDMRRNTNLIIEIQQKLLMFDSMEREIKETRDDIQKLSESFTSFKDAQDRKISSKMGKAWKSAEDLIRTIKGKGKLCTLLVNMVVYGFIAFIILSVISVGMWFFDQSITIDFNKVIEFIKAIRG